MILLSGSIPNRTRASVDAAIVATRSVTPHVNFASPARRTSSVGRENKTEEDVMGNSRTEMEVDVTLTEKKYQLAVLCEECGAPLKLLRVKSDEWFAQCSVEGWETFHRGSF